MGRTLRRPIEPVSAGLSRLSAADFARLRNPSLRVVSVLRDRQRPVIASRRQIGSPAFRCAPSPRCTSRGEPRETHGATWRSSFRMPGHHPARLTHAPVSYAGTRPRLSGVSLVNEAARAKPIRGDRFLPCYRRPRNWISVDPVTPRSVRRSTRPRARRRRPVSRAACAPSSGSDQAGSRAPPPWTSPPREQPPR